MEIMTSTDHEIELSGARLHLRRFRPDDADAIFEAVRESIPELSRWLSWCRADYKIDDTRAFLDGRAEAFRVEGEYAFAILERAGGRFVGACGVNQLDKANARANLGYWMRSSATGRGYAAEATRLLARWAFEALELARIEIVAAVGNDASQRVAAKVGAFREGVARHRLMVHGVPHDAVVFSLLRGHMLGR
jgi:RimJ/RimL family protein N-acetyltransferase